VPLGSLVIAGVLAAVLLRKRPYPLNFPAEAL